MNKKITLILTVLLLLGVGSTVQAQSYFTKNAVALGPSYLGLGLEYERMIIPAVGVVGGVYGYWTGSMLQYGFFAQGRVYPLNFMPNQILRGRIDDVLYANIGLGYGESAFTINENYKGYGGAFTVGIGAKYAVRGPGGFIIAPSLNWDSFTYSSARLQVLFGYSW